MSRDGAHPSLHHDLRGALSAVQMNLQTFQALEAGNHDVTPERRLAIVQRALAALAEAIELADQLEASDPGSAGGSS